MNNADVKGLLDSCLAELESISALLIGIGDGAKPTPYIKKYAVIRASGAIETAFKQIIADRIDTNSHIQVINFIKRKVRDSSCNPKLGMIENMLSEFDDRWRSKFDELMALEDKPRLKGALTNLVEARNDFAHGGNPDMNINDTISFFTDGVRVLELLDSVVHHNFEVD
jgi:hypothetical protein